MHVHFYPAMAGEDGETADPATMPWRDVLSLILSSSHEENHEETARLCLTLLDKATAGAAGDDDVPPADVVATVRTTYVRSLLNAEEYESVVEYCRSYRQTASGGRSGDDDDALYLRQEEAYAQYRLKNYAKARDLCRSSLSAVGCDPNDLTATTSEVPPPLGLIHVYGQALYRLNETESASKVYRFLQSEAGVADDEEAGEIATNALANAAANVTYCGSSGVAPTWLVMRMTSWSRSTGLVITTTIWQGITPSSFSSRRHRPRNFTG